MSMGAIIVVMVVIESKDLSGFYEAVKASPVDQGFFCFGGQASFDSSIFRSCTHFSLAD